MATAADPTSRAAALRPTPQAAAKNLLVHLDGEAGPPGGASFAGLEERALRLGHTLAAELLRQALARQAAAPPAPSRRLPDLRRTPRRR
jgi:hypothetical protein